LISQGYRDGGRPNNARRRDFEKEMGQQDSSTFGERWRLQNKTELGEDKWSVTNAPLGTKRHKSRKSTQPGHPFVGRWNDYRQKLGSKQAHDALY